MQSHYGEITEQLRRSTVHLSDGKRGSGSGVIWSADGLIVTNAHVGEGAEASVQLWDGTVIRGKVEKRNARRDIAAIRVPAGALPRATVADSSSVRVGEVAIAVGNPLGFMGALTTGVIHARGAIRELGRREWIQAAIRLAPGNSGGPLANAKGEIIGINTMIIAGGLGLAIPSNTVEQFLATATPPVLLGVVARPVPLRNRQTIGLKILSVDRASAAGRASLAVGDVLVAANGHGFHAVDDLADLLEGAQDGSVRVDFVRAGSRKVRSVAVDLLSRGTAAA